MPIKLSLAVKCLPGRAYLFTRKVPIAKSKIAEHDGASIMGSVYTVDAVQRSAEEVVESLFRRPGEKPQEPRTPRAQPRHKQVRAALSREREGVMVNATEEIMGWLAHQARQRTAKSEHKTVVIMDGQPSLWEAAHLFYPEGSEAAPDTACYVSCKVRAAP